MLTGRILCLDLGEKRIGVAVSDPLGITAQGAGIICSENNESDIQEILKKIDEKNASLVIIGYPINMDGTKGKKAIQIEDFFNLLKTKTTCECVLWDERLTTKQADRILDEAGYSWKKKRDVIDEMAAQLILQSYLDSHTF